MARREKIQLESKVAPNAIYLAANIEAAAPDTAQKADLNHLHLNVKDLDKSQAFYEKYLGFAPAFEMAPGFPRNARFLRNTHGFLLALEIHPDKRELPSWFHLGFELPTAEAVTKAIERFRADGIEVIGRPIVKDNYVSAVIQDPDGYHLQIYWDPEE